MGGGGAGLAGGPVPDDRANGNKARFFGLGLGGGHGCLNRLDVVSVGYRDDVPPAGAKPCGYVFREGIGRIPVNRNVIVVVQVNEFSETKVAGERGGFLGDALHQVTIRNNAVGVMIDDGVGGAVVKGCEVALGNGHSHARGKALAKRTGRCFHTRSMSELRMTRCAASPLPKRLQVLNREGISTQVKQRIKQHASMSGREHKSIPVHPSRLAGCMPHYFFEKRVSHRGRPHRHSGVTRIRLLYRVNGKKSDSVDRAAINWGDGHGVDKGVSRCRVNKGLLLPRPCVYSGNLRHAVPRHDPCPAKIRFACYGRRAMMRCRAFARIIRPNRLSSLTFDG